MRQIYAPKQGTKERTAISRGYRMKNKKKIGATLLVLGGGKGERMGGNKFFLSVDGEPVARRMLTIGAFFESVVFCVGFGEEEAAERVLRALGARVARVTEDRAPGRGPLEGLRQGLAAMETAWGFLLGIDMPGASEAAIRQMWALTGPDDDVSCFAENGRPNALHAFYRKTCLPQVDAALAGEKREKSEKKSARGGPKIISFYKDVRVREIVDADLAHLPGWRRSFDNFNSPEELEGMALPAPPAPR